MAANSIIIKLNTVLAEPVDSECKVVYVLCETRKLMEDVPAHQRPFALNMYCHWALHVDLHGSGTITPFLQQVDAYVDGVLAGPEDFDASNRMVREFIFLDTFKSQLHAFFEANGIRTELTDDDGRWNEFVRHYAGVIEDGSLSLRADSNGLKHVKEVRFIKGRDAEASAQMPFDMTWCVALLNGRTLDIDVNARRVETGSPMIHSGVHLH